MLPGKKLERTALTQKGFSEGTSSTRLSSLFSAVLEDSWKIHEELVKNAEEIFKGLEIPYHVVNICTGDIGTVAAKKYDIEAWMPRQNKYGEVVSCSNCTDYQARRLNIKCGKEGGEKRVLHTLNSTAVATSRALVAVLENYQNKDGTVTVPKVLVPYMNGLKVLGKK